MSKGRAAHRLQAGRGQGHDLLGLDQLLKHAALTRQRRLQWGTRGSKRTGAWLQLPPFANPKVRMTKAVFW